MANDSTLGQPIPLGIIEGSDAPLVDEALSQPKTEMADEAADQLAALREEIYRISDSVAAMGLSAKNNVRTGASAAEELVAETLRLHPVLSVLSAATVGYGLALLVHGGLRRR